MTITTQARRGLLLALPIAALLLSGCTSASPDPEASNSDSPSGDPMQTWLVNYAGCMQDEGIDYPDPDPNPNAAASAIDIDAMGGFEAYSAADETCRGKVGDPPAPTGSDGKPLSDEEMREQALELAKCLREQGVEVEDPAADGSFTFDQTMPQEALAACGISGLATDGE